MKLRVRYEECLVVLDVPRDENLYICVGLVEDKNVDEKEEEKRIQQAFDELFNMPEYNNLHKFNRHRGYSKARQNENGESFSQDEIMMDEVSDRSIFIKDEISRENQESYDDICSMVRRILIKKPHWAEAFIAIRIDGMSVNDYAASRGLEDANAVSKWLRRAEKRLKQLYNLKQI